jgi:hypothetical protein
MNMQDILKLVFYLSIIVWCLPPIRQYRGYFFDFFLILACIDPISLIYFWVTKTSLPSWVYILFMYLLICSIYTESTLKKYRYIFILLPLGFMLTISFQSKISYNAIMILEFVALLLSFLLELIVFYVNKKKLNVFYLVLVFYILTNILKYFNIIIGFADAFAFFVITTIAQIAFGLFFSIVREDKP